MRLKKTVSDNSDNFSLFSSPLIISKVSEETDKRNLSDLSDGAHSGRVLASETPSRLRPIDAFSRRDSDPVYKFLHNSSASKELNSSGEIPYRESRMQTRPWDSARTSHKHSIHFPVTQAGQWPNSQERPNGMEPSGQRLGVAYMPR